MMISPRQIWRRADGRSVEVLAIDDTDAPWVELRDLDTGDRITMRAVTLVENYERFEVIEVQC